jgi:hypothetical protein
VRFPPALDEQLLYIRPMPAKYLNADLVQCLEADLVRLRLSALRAALDHKVLVRSGQGDSNARPQPCEGWGVSATTRVFFLS